MVFINIFLFIKIIICVQSYEHNFTNFKPIGKLFESSIRTNRTPLTYYPKFTNGKDLALIVGGILLVIFGAYAISQILSTRSLKRMRESEVVRMKKTHNFLKMAGQNVYDEESTYSDNSIGKSYRTFNTKEKSLRDLKPVKSYHTPNIPHRTERDRRETRSYRTNNSRHKSQRDVKPSNSKRTTSTKHRSQTREEPIKSHRTTSSKYKLRNEQEQTRSNRMDNSRYRSERNFSRTKSRVEFEDNFSI
ncbi:hypothetical protein SNEBB_004402 [Seison nebaliae]|nr:hypothetical protein SNEBB_004402 [Seison nebaliae]